MEKGKPNKEQEQKTRTMFQKPQRTRKKLEQSLQILNKDKINNNKNFDLRKQ